MKKEKTAHDEFWDKYIKPSCAQMMSPDIIHKVSEDSYWAGYAEFADKLEQKNREIEALRAALERFNKNHRST